MPRDDYGTPDDQATEVGELASPDSGSDLDTTPEPAPESVDPTKRGRPRNPKPEELEPILLPKTPLVPGQFGPGSIKGGKILNFTLKNERKLLKACSVSANLSTAIRRAGISEKRVRKVLASNPALRQRVQEHLDLATDRLEQCVLQRAMKGVTVPVYGDADENGFCKVVGKRVVPPSDRLAVKLLEGRRPEIYGRNAGEAGSKRVLPVVAMTREQLMQRIGASSATVVDAQEPLKKLKDSKPQ